MARTASRGCLALEDEIYQDMLRCVNGRSSAAAVDASKAIAAKPLRRVHECVFGVPALESEPIDPRL